MTADAPDPRPATPAAAPSPSRTERAKANGGYGLKPNDLITVKETVLLIDSRVSVLLAHWEHQRRQRERDHRWFRRLARWWGRTLARLRRPDDAPSAPAPADAATAVTDG